MAATPINGGNPLPTEKGFYEQPGMPRMIPRINGSFLSVDGYVELGTAYLQSEFPRLYAVLGTTYNEASDDDTTDFRTPTEGNWDLMPAEGGNYKWMIKY